MCRNRVRPQHASMQVRIIFCLGLALAAASGTCEAQRAATLSLVQKAMALPADERNGELLYVENCSGCHRTTGWGNGPRQVPTLAGQQETYLLEQLFKFATLVRKRAEMHEVVTKPVFADPQSLRDVSSYIASRRRDPSPDRGEGTQAGTGGRLYAQSCAICHGNDGEGNREDVVPAIGGQQYGYLLMRLRAFTQDHVSLERGSSEPLAVNLPNLPADEIEAVADYTSRLTALTSR